MQQVAPPPKPAEPMRGVQVNIGQGINLGISLEEAYRDRPRIEERV
jgi:hypothetical protein